MTEITPLEQLKSLLEARKLQVYQGTRLGCLTCQEQNEKTTIFSFKYMAKHARLHGHTFPEKQLKELLDAVDTSQLPQFQPTQVAGIKCDSCKYASLFSFYGL